MSTGWLENNPGILPTFHGEKLIAASARHYSRHADMVIAYRSATALDVR